VVRPQPLEDPRGVIQRLPLAEYDLRNALAQTAMQVQLSVAKVLKGQAAQALERFVDADAAALRVTQKLA
jgi:hypothetical protein